MFKEEQTCGNKYNDEVWGNDKLIIQFGAKRSWFEEEKHQCEKGKRIYLCRVSCHFRVICLGLRNCKIRIWLKPTSKISQNNFSRICMESNRSWYCRRALSIHESLLKLRPISLFVAITTPSSLESHNQATRLNKQEERTSRSSFACLHRILMSGSAELISRSFDSSWWGHFSYPLLIILMLCSTCYHDAWFPFHAMWRLQMRMSFSSKIVDIVVWTLKRKSQNADDFLWLNGQSLRHYCSRSLLWNIWQWSR